MRAPDAVIVGAGPNGLAAAVTFARAGRSVLVLEAEETIGGGMRSAERTLPGFMHDVCSTIHAFGPASFPSSGSSTSSLDARSDRAATSARASPF